MLSKWLNTKYSQPQMNTGIYPHYFLVPMYIDHWQQVPIYSTYICICLVKLFNDIRWISILICYSDLRCTICITVSILGVEALWSDCKAFLGDQGSKSKVAQQPRTSSRMSVLLKPHFRNRSGYELSKLSMYFFKLEPEILICLPLVPKLIKNQSANIWKLFEFFDFVM